MECCAVPSFHSVQFDTAVYIVVRNNVNVTYCRVTISLRTVQCNGTILHSAVTLDCFHGKASASTTVDLRRVAYLCLKARKARCLRNTEMRAMQRKQG